MSPANPPVRVFDALFVQLGLVLCSWAKCYGTGIRHYSTIARPYSVLLALPVDPHIVNIHIGQAIIPG